MIGYVRMCSLQQSTLEHTVITNQTLLPHSKPCDCLFCVYADGSIKRTLAELQVRSQGTTGQWDAGLTGKFVQRPQTRREGSRFAGRSCF